MLAGSQDSIVSLADSAIDVWLTMHVRKSIQPNVVTGTVVNGDADA